MEIIVVHLVTIPTLASIYNPKLITEMERLFIKDSLKLLFYFFSL